jgi:hypothetical protein
MKRCLHQVFRPERKSTNNPPEVGECSECEYNPEENKKCKKFREITIMEIEDE